MKSSDNLMNSMILKLFLLFIFICDSTIHSKEINFSNDLNNTLESIILNQLTEYLKAHILNKSLEEQKPDEKDNKNVILVETGDNKTDIKNMIAIEPMEARYDNEPKGKLISYDYRYNISSPNTSIFSSTSDGKVSSTQQQEAIPVYRETLSGFPAMTMHNEKSPLNIFFRSPEQTDNKTDNHIKYSSPDVSDEEERNHFKPVVPRFQFPIYIENESEIQSPVRHSVEHDDKGFHSTYYIPNYNSDIISDNYEPVMNYNPFPQKDQFWKTGTHEELSKVRTDKKDHEMRQSKPKSIKPFLSNPASISDIKSALKQTTIYPIGSQSSHAINHHFNHKLKTAKNPNNNHLKGFQFYRPMPWFPAIHPLSSEPWIEGMPLRNYNRVEANGQSSNNLQSMLMRRPLHNNNIVRNHKHLKTQLGGYENIKTAHSIPNPFYQQYGLLPDHRFYRVGTTLNF